MTKIRNTICFRFYTFAQRSKKLNKKQNKKSTAQNDRIQKNYRQILPSPRFSYL